MNRILRTRIAAISLFLAAFALIGPDASAADNESESGKGIKPATRAFRFVYGATITGLKPRESARIWIPLATSSPWQEVRRVKTSAPGKNRLTVERQFKNHILYTEALANERGEIPLEVVYEVVRKEFLSSKSTAPAEDEKERFLTSNRQVPVDGTLKKRLLQESYPSGNTIAVGRTLYDVVNHQMRYDKPAGKPWGRGDALWACNNGYGNCTDFHSLFIGLCRDMQIPAKFEIGFPIPTDSESGEVGGYHCWAIFADSDRWVAVDISEADKNPEMTEYYFGRLTPDRLTFTTGRDLELVPAQQAGPVNFLVYPYVEVDGKQHTQFKKQFRFENRVP